MKIRAASILVIILVILTACNIGVNPKEHLGEIYSVALDSIMEKDEALSSDIMSLDGLLLKIDKWKRF